VCLQKQLPLYTLISQHYSINRITYHIQLRALSRDYFDTQAVAVSLGHPAKRTLCTVITNRNIYRCLLYLLLTTESTSRFLHHFHANTNRLNSIHAKCCPLATRYFPQTHIVNMNSNEGLPNTNLHGNAPTVFKMFPYTTLRLSGLLPSGKIGRAIPVPAWTGPEGSRMLRLPDFKTIAT